jgi:hypothetical protein
MIYLKLILGIFQHFLCTHCNLCMQNFMTKWNQTLQIGFLGRVNSDIYKYSWSSMGGYDFMDRKCGWKTKSRIIQISVIYIICSISLIKLTHLVRIFFFNSLNFFMKSVDNHKGVFNLTIQAVSSTHTQVLYISTHTQVLYIYRSYCIYGLMLTQTDP